MDPGTALAIAGINAATSTTSGIMNQSGNAKAQNRQFKYQTYLNDQASMINEQAAQNAYKRQRELLGEARSYDSVGAQISRAKAAGVSPAAALGQNSASGIVSATAAQSAGASGGGQAAGAPSSNWNIQTGAGEALALSAQIRATNAQAERDEAEARSLDGWRRLNAEADTAVKWQNIENLKATEEGQRLGNKMTQYALEKEPERILANLDKLNADTASTVEDLEKKRRENRMDEMTFNDRAKAVLMADEEVKTQMALNIAMAKSAIAKGDLDNATRERLDKWLLQAKYETDRRYDGILKSGQIQNTLKNKEIAQKQWETKIHAITGIITAITGGAAAGAAFGRGARSGNSGQNTAIPQAKAAPGRETGNNDWYGTMESGYDF